MVRAPALARRIRAIYPDLRIASTRTITHGQSNHVIVVNEQLMFRFPRTHEALAGMPVELAILRGVRPFVTLATPEPIYSCVTPLELGMAFIGYPMIAGEPLWRDTFAAIDDQKALDRIAQQLATFLRQLHTVPLTAFAIELPLVARRREAWADLFVRVEEQILPHMEPPQRWRAAQEFEHFLSEAQNFNYRPCLCHRDFATSNILVGGSPLEVSGIIDFGAAGYADPAGDISGVLYGCGEPFLRRMMSHYPQIEAGLARARFYNRSFPLQIGLVAAESGDHAKLRYCIEWYDAISS